MTQTNQQAPEAPKGTAADGKTELFNVPGYPLMVRAVDFNRLHAENERLAALVKAQQPAPSAAEGATYHLGACIVEDMLHATVMRKEPGRAGAVTVLLSEQIPVERLQDRDVIVDAAPQPSPTPQADSAPSAAAAEGEVPLPLLVRDIAADLGTTPIQVCTALAQLGFGGHSVNMAVTPRMAKSLRAHFASPTPQADSQPAPFVDQHSANLSDKTACASPVIDKPAPVLDRARIREIFMAHGFTVKEGQTDLKQYVYDAADALLRAARAPADSVTAPAPLCWLRTASAVSPELAFMPCLPGDPNGYPVYLAQPAQAADSVLEDADPIRALIAEHAAILDQNESAYFELCYHRATGWMAWITDKPLCMPPVVNPDRKVLAQGQGDTADEACRDAARKQGGA